MKRLLAIAWLLCAPAAAWGAVAIDSGFPLRVATPTGSTSVTTPGSNRLVVVLVGVTSGTSTGAIGVSGGTWSFTEVAQVGGGDARFSRVAIFTAYVAAGSTDTVTVTSAGGHTFGQFVVYSLWGASATLGNTATVPGATGTPVVTLNSTGAGSLAFAVFAAYTNFSATGWTAGTSADSPVGLSDWINFDALQVRSTTASTGAAQAMPLGFSVGGSTDTYAAAELEVLVAGGATAATPTATPAAATFIRGGSVALSCASPSPTIRYTTDGSTPTGASATYTAPLAISATTTVQAICQSSGLMDSAAMSAAYWLSGGWTGKRALKRH